MLSTALTAVFTEELIVKPRQDELASTLHLPKRCSFFPKVQPPSRQSQIIRTGVFREAKI